MQQKLQKYNFCHTEIYGNEHAKSTSDRTLIYFKKFQVKRSINFK